MASDSAQTRIHAGGDGGFHRDRRRCGGRVVPDVRADAPAQPDAGATGPGRPTRAGAHGADSRTPRRGQLRRAERSLRRRYAARYLHHHLWLRRNGRRHQRAAAGASGVERQSDCGFQAHNRYGKPGRHTARAKRRSRGELLNMTQSAHIARHGFTLLEVIITLVIAGVLATIGATLMSGGFRSYFLGRELAQDAAQGTLALERMTRDLRAVRSAADLTTIGASTISFVDVDGNTITYALSAGSVTRSQNGGTAQPLAANASSLAFTYLQNDGQTTAASSATVWYIVVAVTVTSQNVGTTFRGTVKPASF